MAASDEFSAFLEEQLADFGPVRVKRMFGGAGLYRDDLMFGLIADDILYLKADEQSRAAFEAAGCEPFVYAGKDRPVTMSYWRAPEECLDDPQELAGWAQGAYEAALRAKATGMRRKRRSPAA